MYTKVFQIRLIKPLTLALAQSMFLMDLFQTARWRFKCLDQAWAGGCQACFFIVLILSAQSALIEVMVTRNHLSSSQRLGVIRKVEF